MVDVSIFLIQLLQFVVGRRMQGLYSLQMLSARIRQVQKKGRRLSNKEQVNK
jgi:hypothetical protein